MPTCGRCQRRNRPEQCVYHPAPLTKSNRLPTPQASEENDSSSPTFALATADPSVPTPATIFTEVPAAQPRVSTASNISVQRSPSTPHSQQTVEELQKPVPQAHVHQLTAYPSRTFMHHAAILIENELSVGILDSNGDAVPTVVSRSYIERGAACLTLLRNFSQCVRFIDKWVCTHPALCHFAF